MTIYKIRGIYRYSEVYLYRDLDKALYYANQGIEKYPDRWEFYDMRGVIYYKQGEYDKSLSDIEKAYELDPYNNKQFTKIENMKAEASERQWKEEAWAAEQQRAIEKENQRQANITLTIKRLQETAASHDKGRSIPKNIVGSYEKKGEDYFYGHMVGWYTLRIDMKDKELTIIRSSTACGVVGGYINDKLALAGGIISKQNIKYYIHSITGEEIEWLYCYIAK
jgi:tetratricopeptide (TPR) repeat protein